MNIIFGAGKFSNVHLKVLREKGIRKAILAKKSFWTDKQKQQGIQIVSYNPDTRKLRFVEHRE